MNTLCWQGIFHRGSKKLHGHWSDSSIRMVRVQPGALKDSQIVLVGRGNKAVVRTDGHDSTNIVCTRKIQQPAACSHIK